MKAPSSSVDTEALSGDEIRLLAEIGFMAARAHHVKAARAIFDGLQALRPGHAFVFIGLAVTSMSAGNPEEAVRVLRDVGMRVLPRDEELQVFLAMALREAKRNEESRRVLDALLARPGSPSPARRLAAGLVRAPQGGLPAPVRQASPRVQSLR